MLIRASSETAYLKVLKMALLTQVMDVLELGEISDKLVGVIGDSGLSVEEAKRLTIGVELVSFRICN